MTHPTRRAGMRRALFISTLLGLLLGSGAVVLRPPTPALAHAEYARSNTAAGAAVRAAPPRLDLWFTQELFRRAGANTITVAAPDGRRVEAGDATVDSADRTHLSVALSPNLPLGTYTVTWTSLSAIDGDDATGTFAFTIDPNAPASAAPVTPSMDAAPAAASPSDQPRGFPIWMAGAVLLLVTSIALASWAVRGEASR